MPSKKIIIADSDIEFANALKEKLSSEPDLEVIVISDGIEALQKTRRLNPDLLIVEENLPSINGYKLARLLKFDTRRSRLPIVLVCGRLDEEKEILAKEVGAEHIMLQNEVKEGLDNLINRYLKK